MSEAAILDKDWEWINATLDRIERDKRYSRLRDIDNLVAALLFAFHGKTDAYESIREACLSSEDKQALQALKEEQVQASGKMLKPTMID